MRQKSNIFAELIAAALFLTAPLAVNAFTIDSSTATNQTFDVSWELMGTDSANPVGQDLSGGATFEYLGISANGSEMLFGLTLTNTSAASTSGDIALRAFGFGNDANFQLASWGSSASGGTNSISDNGSGAGDITGVTAVDPNNPAAGTPDLNTPIAGEAPVECLKDPNNTNPDECVTLLAVADVDGLGAGASDSFQFALDLGQVVSTTPTVTIDPFAVAYSYQEFGKPADQVRIAAATQVPLPGSLALIGIGLLMLRRQGKRC